MPPGHFLYARRPLFTDREAHIPAKAQERKGGAGLEGPAKRRLGGRKVVRCSGRPVLPLGYNTPPAGRRFGGNALAETPPRKRPRRRADDSFILSARTLDGVGKPKGGQMFLPILPVGSPKEDS